METLTLPTKSSPKPDQYRIFRDTQTKIDVLKALAGFFCLSTKDISILLYGDDDVIHTRSVNRTFDILEREGLTDWRLLPTRIRKRGALPAVYGLTYKGVDKVAELGISTTATKVFKPNSDSLLHHEYEISLFHLALSSLSAKNAWELRWYQAGLKRGVNPDACFALTIPNKGTFWFFLEVEKTKPGAWRNGESKIMRNMGRYQAYYDTDICQKDWINFRKFRVIVLLKNEERRSGKPGARHNTGLLARLSEKFSKPGLKPPKYLWLTTEELYKRDLGRPIFKTPKDYESYSYGFLDI